MECMIRQATSINYTLYIPVVKTTGRLLHETPHISAFLYFFNSLYSR